MFGIHFANPARLWFLLVLIPMIVWYFFKYKNSHPTLKFSSFEGLYPKNTFRTILAKLPLIFNFVIVILLIIAFARPQRTLSNDKVIKEGIDIVIAMDISGSMLARDFEPNRLQASIDVASQFIKERENDRMGIVLFSGQSFTLCPLTVDQATLVSMLNQVKNGIIEDGTAIGLGLANAVTRLRSSKSKSKIVILLTDGMNNCGEIDPMTAADIAQTMGIRVYTIGVGKNGMAPFPAYDQFGRLIYRNMEVEIDENTLQIISQKTDGKYFRATGNMSLVEVYKEIDQLEKTKMRTLSQSKTYDCFMPWVVVSICLLLINILLKYTILRQLP